MCPVWVEGWDGVTHGGCSKACPLALVAALLLVCPLAWGTASLLPSLPTAGPWNQGTEVAKN